MLTFKSWLQSLDNQKDWTQYKTMSELEQGIVDTVRTCGYLNLEAIYDRFYLEENPEVMTDNNGNLRWL